MTSSLGLYIHWPFCLSKCPYCDFNSHVHRSITEEDWLQALLKNMYYFREKSKNRSLKSIFFGGGTPSLMAPKTVETVINEALKLWNYSNSLEITLEANPNSVEVSKFKDLNAAGVNRVSIGVQSFNEKDLKFLGRNHSKDEAVQAIEVGLNVFKNVSFDLIYARPNQTLPDWEAELNYAMNFKSPHLSLYQLTIEPGTAFEKQYQRGDWQIPSHKNSIELYDLTSEILEKHGMYPYEISNYALPGFESQHNLLYWRYQDFIGIGPGAHGRLNISNQIHSYKQFSSPLKWYENPTYEEETLLSEYQVFQEKLIMGFRIFNPIFIADHEQKFLNHKGIKQLSKEGFLIYENKSLAITPKGRLVLNSVITTILCEDG